MITRADVLYAEALAVAIATEEAGHGDPQVLRALRLAAPASLSELMMGGLVEQFRMIRRLYGRAQLQAAALHIARTRHLDGIW